MEYSHNGFDEIVIRTHLFHLEAMQTKQKI